MDSEKIKTGLYNRAKNSSNNINHMNAISNKTKILNNNSLNFLKNHNNENKEQIHNNSNEIFDPKDIDKIKTLSNQNLNLDIPNDRLVLPYINKNSGLIHKNVANKTPFHDKKLNEKENLNEDKDIKLNNREFIKNRITSSRNIANHKKEICKEVMIDTNKIIIQNKNIISNKILEKNKLKNINQTENTRKKESNIYSLDENKNKKSPVAIKKPTVRKFKSNIIKEFLKESSIKSIQIFLDPKSLKNFILACKKFYNFSLTNDDLWFCYYTKRYKIEKSIAKYEENRGKWREVFLKSIKKLFEQNIEHIKNKFLKNFNKNKYQVSKDPYTIPNLVYYYMKPTYNIEIDGKLFSVKHIFTNKILSHINFFINFDQEYLDFRKANKIKLFLNEKNLGFSDAKIYEIELKTKKFLNLENEGIKSKICNIFAYNEFILSTFEKNFIFFINISLPICKICDICFDFLKGIHSKNLLYEDDISKNFGLYEYVLLINIKSWKEIFFNLNVNKLDFKRDNYGEFLYYENDSKSKVIYF